MNNKENKSRNPADHYLPSLLCFFFTSSLHLFLSFYLCSSVPFVRHLPFIFCLFATLYLFPPLSSSLSSSLHLFLPLCVSLPSPSPFFSFIFPSSSASPPLSPFPLSFLLLPHLPSIFSYFPRHSLSTESPFHFFLLSPSLYPSPFPPLRHLSPSSSFHLSASALGVPTLPHPILMNATFSQIEGGQRCCPLSHQSSFYGYCAY